MGRRAAGSHGLARATARTDGRAVDAPRPAVFVTKPGRHTPAMRARVRQRGDVIGGVTGPDGRGKGLHCGWPEARERTNRIHGVHGRTVHRSISLLSGSFLCEAVSGTLTLLVHEWIGSHANGSFPCGGRPSCCRTAAIRRSAVNPNFCCNAFSGADAPKVFIPILVPAKPT